MMQDNAILLFHLVVEWRKPRPEIQNTPLYIKTVYLFIFSLYSYKILQWKSYQ